jgi:hypothetical protein
MVELLKELIKRGVHVYELAVQVLRDLSCIGFSFYFGVLPSPFLYYNKNWCTGDYWVTKPIEG